MVQGDRGGERSLRKGCHVATDFGQIGAPRQVARECVEHRPPAQDPQCLGECGGIARTGCDPCLGCDVTERRIQRRVEPGPVFRVSGERARRVVAVGEGGGEIEGKVHAGPCTQNRTKRCAELGWTAGSIRYNGAVCSIMPFARASFRALATLGPALRRLGRIVSTAVVVGFALFALALLAVRFIVFPRIDTYRDALTAALAAQLGQPVEIASLSTGWDGWNPKLVIGGLRVQDRARASDVPLLELPEVDLIVAWTSLPLLELRLKQLVIERPRLAIRRDRAGVLHLAGLEFDPAAATDDLPLTDWILRQRQILIHDALVTWNDDSRNAPQLVLDRVQFRLENRFGRHRFGIAGTPPPDLAAPIDIRGDVQGGSLKQWQKARGKVYVRLDYADVAAWREWLPLPSEIVGGKGALRVWFDFAAGEAREMVADLELANVKARLGEHLPELALAHLSGRVGWRNEYPQREVSARDLAFVTTTGAPLEPTNFTFSMREATADNGAGGQFEFDKMQLQPLRELAAFLPLPARWRNDLARFAPRGTLTRGHLRWEGTTEAPTTFAGGASFADLGILAQDTFPGASGFSGSVDAPRKAASSN